MPSSGEEQRIHSRAPLVLQVRWPDLEGYLADSTENLSVGGAFVRTDRSLSVGETLPVRLAFPGLLEPLELTCVVMWVRAASEGRPRGVGIKVPEDRLGDRARLAKLVGAHEATAAPATRSFRILLVEDNPHLMALYEYVMKKLARADQVQVEVEVAKDGYDALGRLGQENFDLVLTDLYMPVLDGFEFIRKLRANPKTKNLPVVAISAGGGDAQELANEAGASVFLRKPVRFVEVLETVRALLKLS